MMIILTVWIVSSKNKLESHKKLFENKDFSGVVIPSEDTKILEFHQDQKSNNASSIIYANLESIIKKFMDVKIILIIYNKNKCEYFTRFFNVYDIVI